MRKIVGLFSLLLVALSIAAQIEPTPPQSTAPDVQPMDEMPVFRVKVVTRSTKAVNYRHRGGSTRVDFVGTNLMPEAKGSAKVNSKEGRLQINADFNHMGPASKYGAQYLTFVLWAITPEGRSVNLGEVLSDDGSTKIEVTTDLQAFGMIVTAEPYFAVVRPSNVVVLENVIRQETKGFETAIDARFDMLEGDQYVVDVSATQLPSSTSMPNTPVDLLEARNAVAIAKAAGADQYAGDSLRKAQDMLNRAEDYLKRKQGRTPIGTAARGATQMAEDARVLTLQKKHQEKVEAERRRIEDARAKAEADAKAAAEAEAAAKAQSEADARRRAQAEADQLAAEKARAEAQRLQAEADAQRAAADAARAQAQLEQQKAQAESEKNRLAAEEAIVRKKRCAPVYSSS